MFNATPIANNAVIVIQPGSYYLRIGRASDAFPHTIPHCIAHRRCDGSAARQHEDEIILRQETQHAGFHDQLNRGLQTAMEIVQNRPTSYGDSRQAVLYTQLYGVNQYSTAEYSDVLSPLNWTSTLHKPQHLIGQEALYLEPGERYNLHWPIRRGHLNLHKGANGSLSAVMEDLQRLWGMAIANYLDIPLSTLKHYRAVLLIPDVYECQHVRELVSLLLDKLHFAAAFVVQESVCVTLGAGVNSACVVDMGDEKTSVCCVEDASSQKHTQICMEYGGSDITRCFYELLLKSGFPYHECDLSDRMDAIMLQELKETHCHLDQDVSGCSQEVIQVKTPGKLITRYPMQLADERILAPMATFAPEMMGLQSASLCRHQSKYHSDSSDYLDDDYLLQTQSKHEQAAKLIAARKRENAEQASQTNTELSFIDDPQLDDDDTMDQSECSDAMMTAGSRGGKKLEDEEEESMMDGLLGLDQAIIRSIDKCDNENMKRRMLSCIVVVGGGFMFSGADTWLQYLISTQMPPSMSALMETLEVSTRPKDLDPRIVAWKGGAVLCCLDAAQELWVTDEEWRKWGVRMLRERAPFTW